VSWYITTLKRLLSRTDTTKRQIRQTITNVFLCA
jgi:hypothetical protein